MRLTRAFGFHCSPADGSEPAGVPERVDSPAVDNMSLLYRREGRNVVVEVVGELDLNSVGHLDQRLADLIDDQGCRSIVLDLHGLQFIGSSGLMVLLRAHQLAQSRGSEITLAHVPPMARRVIETCGLLSTFNIKDDPDGAHGPSWSG
jgi:anti-anti-sigma factor